MSLSFFVCVYVCLSVTLTCFFLTLCPPIAIVHKCCAVAEKNAAWCGFTPDLGFTTASVCASVNDVLNEPVRFGLNQ